MSLARKKLGKAGEDVARKYLKRRGHRILAKNYTFSIGEIDLITYHEDCIVFVEVKTRSDPQTLDTEFPVSRTQRRHAVRAAQAWLSQHRDPDCAYRFDAVSVVLPRDGEPSVRHIVDAFTPSR